MTTAISPAPIPTLGAVYLSRLALERSSTDLRADLANSQAMHRRMLDAFPSGTSREQAGLLYRIDPDRSGRPEDMILLAQSTIEPDWTKLPHGYTRGDDFFGWSQMPAVQVKPVSQHFATIKSGNAFSFRLRANPTMRESFRKYQRAHPDEAAARRRQEGPRVAIRDEEQLEEWLTRKGTMHGFQLRQVRFAPDRFSGGWQIGTKLQSGEERRPMTIEHSAVVFDGLLVVADVEAFRRALVAGIGSGKAYGFGLLSLGPA